MINKYSLYPLQTRLLIRDTSSMSNPHELTGTAAQWRHHGRTQDVVSEHNRLFHRAIWQRLEGAVFCGQFNLYIQYYT